MSHCLTVQPFLAATLPAKRGQEHPLVKFLLHRHVSKLREDFNTELKEVWKGMTERDRKQVNEMDLPT
jgi:hypothetical protein